MSLISIFIKSKNKEFKRKICGHEIFNADSFFGMRNLCINCYEAYEEGVINGSENIYSNNYGFTWYNTSSKLYETLTLEMLKEGYYSVYDRLLKAHRIHDPKPKSNKNKNFWRL